MIGVVSQPKLGHAEGVKSTAKATGMREANKTATAVRFSVRLCLAQFSRPPRMGYTSDLMV